MQELKSGHYMAKKVWPQISNRLKLPKNSITKILQKIWKKISGGVKSQCSNSTKNAAISRALFPTHPTLCVLSSLCYKPVSPLAVQWDELWRDWGTLGSSSAPGKHQTSKHLQKQAPSMPWWFRGFRLIWDFGLFLLKFNCCKEN